MEISDDQLTKLLSAPWLARTDADTKTTYLIKFHADPVELTCAVLITDTKRVWAEVVHGRHISLRTEHPEPIHKSPKHQLKFRREQLALLHTAHSLAHVRDMEISTQENGQRADLALTITNRDLVWRWDAFALHPSHAAQVLSRHLFLPMVSLTSVVVGMASSGAEWGDVQKQIDKTSKTARITPHSHVCALFNKPVVACGLARISQVWERADEDQLHPIVQDLEELQSESLEFEPLSESEPEPEYADLRSSPAPLRSSSAPLPSDGDGSVTEDDDDDAGETQIQTQDPMYGEASRYGQPQASRYGQSQSQVSRLGGQSQVSRQGTQYQASRLGAQSQASRLGAQSQPQSHYGVSRPPIPSAQSQPQPSLAQLSMLGAGARSKSQPQPKKRLHDDSDSDDDERDAELKLRMRFGATGGAIGSRRRAGRKF